MESGEKKLISIIIPVFNVEKYLNRCVESIVKQTYKNLEIILVDDGSPDNSPKLCDEWARKDSRIKVIHKENGGVSSARNVGIQNALGDYIAFVDSDDWIDEAMCEKVVEHAIKTNADMVFFKFRRVYENGKVFENKEVALESVKRKDIKVFFTSCTDKNGNYLDVMGSACRILFKKNIAQSCLFSEKLKHGEDLFFVLNCLEKANKVEVLDEVLYNYYYNDQSVTTKVCENYFQNITTLFKHERTYFKEKNLSDYEYFITHAYVSRVVAKMIQQKHFVKNMKNLCKNDELLKECLNKNYYKKIQKEEKYWKSRIRNFIIYHKMWWLYKMVVKLK